MDSELAIRLKAKIRQYPGTRIDRCASVCFFCLLRLSQKLAELCDAIPLISLQDVYARPHGGMYCDGGGCSFSELATLLVMRLAYGVYFSKSLQPKPFSW